MSITTRPDFLVCLTQPFLAGELQPCTPDLCPFALPADASPLVPDPLQLLINLPQPPPPPPTPPPPSPFPSPSAPLENPGDLVLGSLPPNLTAPAPDPLTLNSSASLPSSPSVPFLYSTGLPPDGTTTSPPAYATTGAASHVARRLASFSTPAAQPLLINRVPYFGRGAFTLAANRLVPPNHALAALRSFTFALTYQDGWPLALDPTTRTSPVRNTHLSPDNIGVWVTAGYDREDTLAFLLSIQVGRDRRAGRQPLGGTNARQGHTTAWQQYQGVERKVVLEEAGQAEEDWVSLVQKVL